MKKLIVLSITIIILLSATVVLSEEQVVGIQLTQEELDWIEKNPVVTVAPLDDYAPVEFWNGQSFEGVSADYLSEVSKITGLQFDYVHYDTWPQILEAVKSGEVDIQSAIHKVPDRVNDFLYTEHYITIPNKVFVRSDYNRKLTNENLFDHRVGIMEGYSVYQYIDLIFTPDEVTSFTEVEEAILALSFGEIDALVLDIAQASYYVRALGVSNVEISHDVDIDFNYRLSFAAGLENERLIGILSKALKNVSATTKDQISNKWIYIGNFYNISDEQLSLLYFSLGLSVVLIILAGFWLQSLRVRDRKLAAANEALEMQIRLQQETHDKLIESEKINSLSRLVIGVAHEINTPLGNSISLISFVEHLLSGSANNEQFDVQQIMKPVDKIESQLGKISALIEKMKTIGAPKKSQAFEAVVLAEKIEAFINLLKLSEENKQLEFEMVLDENIVVECVPSTLYQTLGELIENCRIHAYDHLGGLIRITLYREHDENYLSIKDNGKGMTEEMTKKIFEPFYSSSTNASGSGLGLYGVYYLVKTGLAGELEVTSSIDAGTEFLIRFTK